MYSTKMRYEIKHSERNKTNKHKTPQKLLLTFWYLSPDFFKKKSTYSFLKIQKSFFTDRLDDSFFA